MNFSYIKIGNGDKVHKMYDGYNTTACNGRQIRHSATLKPETLNLNADYMCERCFPKPEVDLSTGWEPAEANYNEMNNPKFKPFTFKK